MSQGEDLSALLLEAAARMDLELTEVQIGQLRRHLEILLLWRRRMALVSQRAPRHIVAKHFEDSLAIVRQVPAAARVADLGTGAGFPGLVIAVACPGADVVLVESKRRKVSFLREVVRLAALGNVEVVESRAEDLLGGATWQAAFDRVVSRAVWPAAEFFSLARPLLRAGGSAIAMRTPADGEELATDAGYRHAATVRYQLSGGEDRTLVIATRESPERQ